MAGTIVLPLHPTHRRMPVAKAENQPREATSSAPTATLGRCSRPWSGMARATSRLTRWGRLLLGKVIAASLMATQTPDGTAALVAVMLGIGKDGEENATTRRSSGMPAQAAVAAPMPDYGTAGLPNHGLRPQGGGVRVVQEHMVTPARSRIRPCTALVAIWALTTGHATTTKTCRQAVNHVQPAALAVQQAGLRRLPLRWQIA
mmetsp:Transcript_23399/g.47412  ORF Transcript_23399/g.47412 Transcript_23399/m.47412 type:complete len:203 (+) Transcript_23399:572-1180(+)